MKVTLPKDREYSGEEILAAFTRAAASEIPGKQKWFVSSFSGEVEYKPGSVRRVVHQGAIATMRVWAKRWVFLGEYRWMVPSAFGSVQKVQLSPVSPEDTYASVEIKMARVYNDNCLVETSWVAEDLRSHFEWVIGKFFAELQKNPVPV